MAKNTETQEEKLARVTANYLKIIASPDHGETNAERYLESENMNNASFHKSLQKQGQKKDNSGFWDTVAKGAGNIAESFTSAMTAGQSIYLQAGVDMLASQFGEDEGMSYSEALKNARNRQHKFRQENPGSALLTDVAGGAIPGIGAANIAMKTGAMTVQAGRPISNVISQAKVDAPVAAVEEFSRSISKGEDVDTATTKGAVGSGFGLIGAGASGVIEKFGRPLANYISDGWNSIWGTSPATKRLTKQEEKVADQVQTNLDDEGLTRQDIIERADELDALGVGDDVRLAQLAGPESQSTVKNLGITPGGTKTQIQTELVDDLESSSDKVANIIRRDMGFNDEGDKAIKLGIENRARAKAKPLYDIAYQLPNINNVEIDSIIRQVNDATKGDFYDEVIKLSKLRNAHIKEGQIPLPEYTPESMPYGNIPVRVIDIFQRAVRDLAKKAKGEESKELWRLREVLLDLTEKETKASFTQLLKEGYTPGRGVTNSRLLKQFPQLKEMPDNQTDEFFQTLDAGDGTYSSPFSLARKEWGGTLSNIDAYEKGATALKPSKRASVVKEEWDELTSQAEKDNYRLAAATHAIEGIEGATAETKNFAKIFLSEGQREKFLVMFDNNPEKVTDFIRRLEIQNEAHKSTSGMMPRSDTAENALNFFSHLREWMSTSSIENKMLQAGGRVVQRVVGEGLLKKQNKALADAYIQKGTDHARTQMQKAGKRESDLTRRAMNQARIGGGLSTGLSGLLSPETNRPGEGEGGFSPDSFLKQY